jgi:BirA family biotin operon repressor/biotin-[acetyl-CoA-carboxylase] ligase
MDAPSAPAAAPAHGRWSVDALIAQLQPVLPGVEVEVVPRLDSTNTRLLERARLAGGDRDAPITSTGAFDGVGDGTTPTPLGRRAADLVPGLLVAEEQTAGRGRLGRGWRSALGRSLTFSLGLPMAPAHWGGLSLAVAVALAEALEPEPATPRLLLKWPNDLWLRDAAAPAGGRKLGGVLIETVAVSRHRRVVVGVGLNVLPLPQGAEPASALAHGYASLSEIDVMASAPKALGAVALPLALALRRFEREGFAPFAAGYGARDLLRGRAVAVQGAPPLEGTAEGVDSQGALRVRDGDRVHLVVSGEASVRLTPGPPGGTA